MLFSLCPCHLCSSTLSPSLPLLFLQEGDASYRSGVPVVPVGLLLQPLPKALPSSAMPTLGLSPEQTLANKHRNKQTKQKKQMKIKKTRRKKKICRVTDAPTYFLNQKWSVKKSIYGDFHSLFYVSILVPFVLFPAGFSFLLLKLGTVRCQNQKWQTESGQSTNFCVWCYCCSCVETYSTCVENVNLQLYFKTSS